MATGGAAWLRRSLERRSLLFALALAVGTSAGLVAATVGIVDAALAPVSGADAADGRLLAPLVWAVAGVPIAAVGLLGAAAVRELTRLLGVLRAGETAVIRSRGATRGRLVAASALETLAVSLPAAAVGVGVAAGAGSLLGGASLPPAAWLAVPAAAGAAVAIAALGTRGAITGAVLADRATSAGRVRRTMGAGGIILLAAAASVAVWQSAISRPAPGAAPSPVTQTLVAAAPARGTRRRRVARAPAARTRVRLPGVRAAAGALRRRERRGAAADRRHPGRGAGRAGRGTARTGRARGARRAAAGGAVRRPAAARRDRAGARELAARAARR